mgnify:CR=1 FL=1|jgi:hypothetical protein
MNVEVVVDAQISTSHNIKNENLKMTEELKQFIEIEFEKLRSDVTETFKALRLKLAIANSQEQ